MTTKSSPKLIWEDDLNLKINYVSYYLWDIVVWSVGSMVLCIWQSVSPGLLIANKLFEYVGEQCFSIYLLHPVINTFSKAYLVETYETLQHRLGSYAFFVSAILVTTLILMLAEFTYRFIEAPGIRLGRKSIAQGKHV